ncbi:ribokinase [Tianweitania sediminis]|uniref:Ribokinase n=1 Tax=Tianweitania sediminis TaxID=1502156 RepID=A0A8J7R4K5_9HYPH|nr:ribokinase [Tianweitania sediminis]MBP0441073.1 ribokinase [Tianweitania sediminis]HEV7417569.1 ribokinase [Tianweitania sediminis]
MIIVIGSINLDLITTVNRLPSPGETVSGTRFHTAPGGKGANQALAAARAGSPVRMIGAVGHDAFAGEALALLKASSADLTGVRTVEEPTGTALILVDAKGENIIAVTAGANGRVDEDDLRACAIGKGDVVLLQHEIPLPTVDAALRAANDAGAVSILNTAPFRAEAADLLPLASIVVANETEFALYAEALALAGATLAQRMESFVEQTRRTLIVTLGGEGALAQTPDGALTVPSLAIEPVDTVGAGDTFCGVLAAGLHDGVSLDQALRRAAVAGALACLKPGAQPSIPTRAEIDTAMSGS